MRTAVVADVHGNLEALKAVIADIEAIRPDAVIHGGDLGFNGSHPSECIDLIRQLGWPGVKGNTDDLLAGATAQMSEALLKVGEIERELIGEERCAWLGALPIEHHGQGFAVVHAAPGDIWKIVPKDSTDAQLHEVFGALGVPLAVYGHIHEPFVRFQWEITVANTGSVGMPFDGDPRASYLLITDGEAEVRRVPYDVEKAIADVEKSGLPTVAILSHIYRTGRYPEG